MKTGINALLSALLFAISLPFSGNATSSPDSVNNVRIKIEKESFIIIHGKTNVNKFQCRYDELSPGKNLDLNVFFTDECLVFENAELKIETDKFDCGNRVMNQDFSDLLMADQFPFIGIDIQCINTGAGIFRAVPVRTLDKSAVVSTNFKIAGKENEYQIPVEIRESGKKRIYTGEMMINIRDFGIEPPKKMLGMVVVEERIVIQFHLVVSLVK